MTDLASQKALTRSAPNLPLSWYFDPRILEVEQKLLFARGPGYVGHEQMAPNPGDYRVLDWRSGGAWSLINNGGKHDLVSNVCRHRQAIMLKGAGTLPGGTITCPLHRWSYDGDGKHLGAPSFQEKVCMDLPRQGLQRFPLFPRERPRHMVGDTERAEGVAVRCHERRPRVEANGRLPRGRRRAAEPLVAGRIVDDEQAALPDGVDAERDGT
jgi:nitrite reductase/ring-hydroxylating ferredoxin subunit